MSLLRLLTAGKSLVGLKESGARYQLSSPRAMPKFGGKKNPFRVTTRPDCVAPAAAPVETEPEAAARTPEPVPFGAGAAAPELVPAAFAGEAKAGAEEPVGPPAEKLAENRGIARGYVSKVLSLLGRRRVATARAVVPRMSKPMVQGELSLERVKVVRNDLSDSDLEVVARRAVAGPGKGSRRAVEAAAGGAWERVSERFFGMGKL